jgi:hypothetical protein
MHQVAERESVLALVEFGFDVEHLFVRIDGSRRMADALAHGVELSVNFLKPSGLRVSLRRDGAESVAARLEARSAGGAWRPRACQGLRAAVGAVVELQLPFRCLDLGTHDPVAFIVALNREGVEVEHHPRHQPIEFDVPDAQFGARNWTA